MYFKKTAKILPLFVLISFFYLHANEKKNFRAVTYEVSEGRFGDQLLCYLHAKWISHVYNLPLLFKEFQYSDQLILDDFEGNRFHNLERKYKQKKVLGYEEYVHEFIQNAARPTLYIIPYFPESTWEFIFYGYKNRWPHFYVGWKNKEFRSLIKNLVQPKNKLNLLSLPKDKISVCVHVRRGKEYDGSGMEYYYPLKFPPDEFYIEQIRKIYVIFGEVPLYVHVMTDDSDSKVLLEKIKNALVGTKIEFGIRMENNFHNLNVLEDFFSMLQFDCLIHGESNFAQCASILGEYLVRIKPKSFHWQNDGLSIDDVDVYVDESLFKSDPVKET